MALRPWSSQPDDIVTDLGGVDAVGLDTVLARTRDGFVLLEHRRLDGEEVTEMLVPILDRLPASLETASLEQLDAFVELVELAARFGPRHGATRDGALRRGGRGYGSRT